MPGCVCPKVKDMGPFSASREWNEWEYFTQNRCKICCITQYRYEFMLSIVYNELQPNYKQYKNNQKMMDCERPFGKLHFRLILHHSMGMKYAEEPFNMGMFFFYLRPKASFKMDTFSDPQHTHLGIFILEPPPPPPPASAVYMLSNRTGELDTQTTLSVPTYL